MRLRIYHSNTLNVKENSEGKKFYSLSLGSETHGKTSLYIWINYNLVDKENNKIFWPVFGTLYKTEKGNLVITNSEEFKDYRYWIFPVLAKAGFRGSSELSILAPELATGIIFREFHSPLGNLGISQGMLIMTPTFPVKLQAKYTGRLYGDPPEEIAEIRYNTKGLEIISFEDDPSDIENLI